MALENAPYWTDLYYSVVEYYFWRPQAIGRKSDPDKPSRPWNHWKDKLESQETPLNHILDFLFHIAPQELLDKSISALLGRSITELQLVAPTDGTLDPHVVQPDIIVSNGKSLVFVEMKVDSQSSVDQFAKYAIAAHCIIQNEPQITSVDLVVLSRHKDHNKVWKNAKKLSLSSDEAIRKMAIQGIAGDHTIWCERGVQRFLKNNPTDAPFLIKQMESMGLHLTDYETLELALNNYASQEKAVSRLVEGVLKEFDRRNLVS